MNQAVATASLNSETIAHANHPAWLAAEKAAAFSAFAALPFPSTEMEDWRRTDVSRVHLDALHAPAADRQPGQPDGGELTADWRRAGEGGALVTQEGGAARVHTAVAELSAQGITVSTLEEAAVTHPDLVRRHLGSVVSAESGKFAALSAAFWRGGCFVHVPRGVAAAVPVWAIAATSPDPAEALLPRSLVVVEEGGSLIYTDQYLSPAGEIGRRFSSAVTEVVLGDGASIQYLVLQQFADAVDHFATHRIHLGRDCRAELVVAATGAATSKTYMEVALQGPGSTARISGLCIADGDQHFDYQSLQDHQSPHCTSDLLVKSALRDRAVSVYSGLIKIRKEAQHSDAYQANRNLMLSPDARADSIPRLEIEANDVRCTHGATVGQVDSEQLFYLRSRGIGSRDAQNLVVHGFFQPVIDRIALPGVRAQIHEAIDRELASLETAAA